MVVEEVLAGVEVVMADVGGGLVLVTMTVGRVVDDVVIDACLVVVEIFVGMYLDVLVIFAVEVNGINLVGIFVAGTVALDVKTVVGVVAGAVDTSTVEVVDVFGVVMGTLVGSVSLTSVTINDSVVEYSPKSQKLK